MTQVSRFPVSKDIADRIFDVFIKSLITIKSSKDANNLADDLFSPTEKIMLAKRLAIAYLLMQQYQYREISKLLKVSLTTIASVNLALKYGHNGYVTILDRIAKEEKLESFFLNMAEKLLAPVSIGSKAGAWRSIRTKVQKAQYKRSNSF